MKKLILTLFTAIAFINVQAQCNSNPISDNGASGTVNFSDSSSVTPGWSTNYSVSYLWDFGVKSVSINFFIVLRFKIFLIILLSYLILQKYIVICKLQFILS